MTSSANLYSQNYKLLNSIINYKKITEDTTLYSPHHKPLKIQCLIKYNNTIRLAIAHYKIINDDPVPDPEVIIDINTKQKFIAAISYQDEFGFRPVYDKNRNIDILARNEINEFLRKWLIRLKKEQYSRCNLRYQS